MKEMIMYKKLNKLALAVMLFVSSVVWYQTANADTRAQAMEKIAASMLKDIGQTTWISEGKSTRIIYIFFDPNCPYCHRLFLNTRDWVKQNKVELRWIPVGILTTTSAGKAAAILGAKDPRKAFYENEDGYKRGDGGGGIEEDIASSKTEKKLKANEALLARTGFGAVPLMLFEAKDGTPIMLQGAPPPEKLAVVLKYVK